MSKRAETDEDKELLLERLYEAWIQLPELRLGQLLYCSCYNDKGPERDMFNVEDEALVAAVEKLAHLGE